MVSWDSRIVTYMVGPREFIFSTCALALGVALGWYARCGVPYCQLQESELPVSTKAEKNLQQEDNEVSPFYSILYYSQTC
eukprot:gene7200-9664_t